MGFEDDGASGSDCRANLVRHQIERVVERRDPKHHADGHRLGPSAAPHTGRVLIESDRLSGQIARGLG